MIHLLLEQLFLLFTLISLDDNVDETLELLSVEVVEGDDGVIVSI